MEVIVHVGDKKIELGEITLNDVDKVISVFEHIKTILHESDKIKSRQPLPILEGVNKIVDWGAEFIVPREAPEVKEVDLPVSSLNPKYDHNNYPRYKCILECPYGYNCEHSNIYFEEENDRRRRCQYWHDSQDCLLGSRWCPDIHECPYDIHGCTRIPCDYGKGERRYNSDTPCRKLFSCPFYHSTEEYDDWINAGLLDQWLYNPASYI